MSDALSVLDDAAFAVVVHPSDVEAAGGIAPAFVLAVLHRWVQQRMPVQVHLTSHGTTWIGFTFYANDARTLFGLSTRDVGLAIAALAVVGDAPEFDLVDDAVVAFRLPARFVDGGP